MERKVLSILDYARCEGCGAFRRQTWFLSGDRTVPGNRCCGSMRVIKPAYDRSKDGVVTMRVRWHEGLRYKIERFLGKLGLIQ